MSGDDGYRWEWDTQLFEEIEGAGKGGVEERKLWIIEKKIRKKRKNNET